MHNLEQINDDYYECLTAETTIELLEACKAGKPPAMGRWGSLPMNGQAGFYEPILWSLTVFLIRLAVKDL